MRHDEILHWLLTTDEARLGWLWEAADRARREHVGGGVLRRGLVEFSNQCGRACLYCGMRHANTELPRYRMTHDEILACAHEAERRGYGTVVLQAGEDHSLPASWVSELVLRIKRETSLAITLSLGEQPTAVYAAWRAAGADRYLLRFETADGSLLRRVHPPLTSGRDGEHPRLACVRTLQRLGYETGSGFLVGLPGQTYANVARDIALVRDLALPMVGIGCFVPHPGTPLGQEITMPATGTPGPDTQVPADAVTTLKAVALVRVLCPRVNLPATTALATVSEDGYAAGLRRGCNVVMPNLTPPVYRERYDIYPSSWRHGDVDDGSPIEACIAACGRVAVG